LGVEVDMEVVDMEAAAIFWEVISEDQVEHA